VLCNNTKIGGKAATFFGELKIQNGFSPIFETLWRKNAGYKAPDFSFGLPCTTASSLLSEKLVSLGVTFHHSQQDEIEPSIRGLHDVSADSSVRALRTALYVEWRRWDHLGTDIPSDKSERIRAVYGWLLDQKVRHRK
jgi:hypothetical protein